MKMTMVSQILNTKQLAFIFPSNTEFFNPLNVPIHQNASMAARTGKDGSAFVPPSACISCPVKTGIALEHMEGDTLPSTDKSLSALSSRCCGVDMNTVGQSARETRDRDVKTMMHMTVPDTDPSDEDVLIIGTSKTSGAQTSLVFQAAVSHTALTHSVVYIAPQPLLSLPMQVHGMPCPEPTSMKHLKMLYLQTWKDLLEYASSLHQQPVIPDVLIIDGLHHYICNAKGDSIQHNTAKLCAFLTDALHFMKQKNGDQCCMMLCAEDVKSINTDWYERFMKNIFLIAAAEDGHGGYKLTQYAKHHNNNNLAKGGTVIRFKEQREQLYLIDIYMAKDTSSNAVTVK